MKTLIHFECEKCHTLYTQENSALYCEAYELPPCKVQPGDTVHVITRYDGVKEDKCRALLLVAHYLTGSLRAFDDQGPQGLERFLARLKEINHKEVPMHEWVVVTEQEWQIGKDYYTNDIPACNIIELGGTPC